MERLRFRSLDAGAYPTTLPSPSCSDGRPFAPRAVGLQEEHEPDLRGRNQPFHVDGDLGLPRRGRRSCHYSRDGDRSRRLHAQPRRRGRRERPGACAAAHGRGRVLGGHPSGGRARDPAQPGPLQAPQAAGLRRHRQRVPGGAPGRHRSGRRRAVRDEGDGQGVPGEQEQAGPRADGAGDTRPARPPLPPHALLPFRDGQVLLPPHGVLQRRQPALAQAEAAQQALHRARRKVLRI